MRILIAGEEAILGQFLKQGLELDGHEVHCVGLAREATAALATQPPDLLVLDLPLTPVSPEPGAAGGDTHWIAELRSINDEVPMLVLTASREVSARVGCLDRGADDCMLKPLSVQELRARCRALLRRRTQTGLVLRCDGIELDRVSHTVEQEGRPVPLTNREFALLECLMMHRGVCISRGALLARIWNQEGPEESNIVDVYINYLRRKLGKSSPMIRTVRGQGYRVGAGPPAATGAQA